MSAMRCSACGSEEAAVLPADAADLESEWQCDQCEARFPAKDMEREGSTHSAPREQNNPQSPLGQMGQIWPQGTCLTLFSWPEKEF